jgi:hypothetical protein
MLALLYIILQFQVLVTAVLIAAQCTLAHHSRVDVLSCAAMCTGQTVCGALQARLQPFDCLTQTLVKTATEFFLNAKLILHIFKQ